MTHESILTILIVAILCLVVDNLNLRMKLKRVNEFNGSRLGRIVNGSTEVVR